VMVGECRCSCEVPWGSKWSHRRCPWKLIWKVFGRLLFPSSVYLGQIMPDMDLATGPFTMRLIDGTERMLMQR
jgi:hypothetical protein